MNTLIRNMNENFERSLPSVGTAGKVSVLVKRNRGKIWFNLQFSIRHKILHLNAPHELLGSLGVFITMIK